LKHHQKRLKKDKYLNDPAFSKVQSEPATSITNESEEKGEPAASTNGNEEKDSNRATEEEINNVDDKVHCTNSTKQTT
jgi:hypothetical protein